MLDSPRAQRYHSGAGQARAAEDGMAYDLLIRNGMIVDGTGFSRYQADVAIQDGTIAEIGRVRGAATRTIDAEGLFVAPGIIDLDRKSTRLNSSHLGISYAVFCLKKKKNQVAH